MKPRKEHPPDYVRQYLHLRPRTASFTSLLRIRNAATQAMNHFFQVSAGFYVVASLSCKCDNVKYPVTGRAQNILETFKTVP